MRETNQSQGRLREKQIKVKAHICMRSCCRVLQRRRTLILISCTYASSQTPPLSHLLHSKIIMQGESIAPV
jgi:hypothetical protein